MAVMVPLPTGISSGTPAKVASEMSITNRGGSAMVKVVKLGFFDPTISIEAPFTVTWVMVFMPDCANASAGSIKTAAANRKWRADMGLRPHREQMVAIDKNRNTRCQSQKPGR